MDISNISCKKGFNLGICILEVFMAKTNSKCLSNNYQIVIFIFMGISESWLKDELPSNLLDTNGYNVIRLDRTWKENDKFKKGAGVCV